MKRQHSSYSNSISPTFDILNVTVQSETKSDKGIIGEFDGDRSDSSYPSSLKTFLQNKFSFISKELDENFASKAFDGYEITATDSTEEITWWKTLSVDLEKKKEIGRAHV